MTAVATKFPRRRDGTYSLDPDLRLKIEAFLGHPLAHEKFDSVTTVLGSAPAKPALVRWFGVECIKKVLSDPWRYATVDAVLRAVEDDREHAADRGKTIHSWVEAYAKGAPLVAEDVPEAFRGYAQSFVRFAETLREHKVLYTEANIYNDTYGYAGTMDLLLQAPNGTTVQYDFKTNKNAAVYVEAELQSAAYRSGEFIVTHDILPQILAMPRVDEAIVVGLGPDGNYTPRRCGVELKDFLAALQLHRLVKARR